MVPSIKQHDLSHLRQRLKTGPTRSPGTGVSEVHPTGGRWVNSRLSVKTINNGSSVADQPVRRYRVRSRIVRLPDRALSAACGGVNHRSRWLAGCPAAPSGVVWHRSSSASRFPDRRDDAAALAAADWPRTTADSRAHARRRTGRATSTVRWCRRIPQCSRLRGKSTCVLDVASRCLKVVFQPKLRPTPKPARSSAWRPSTVPPASVAGCRHRVPRRRCPPAAG